MSNIRTDQTNFATQLLNTWGRLRTGIPVDMLGVDAVAKYGVEPGYTTTTVGTASSTFLPNQSAYELTIGTASGDKIVRETQRSQNFNPGRGNQAILTGTMGPQKVGVRTRVGYFGEQNGIFFERDENQVSAVIRSNTTGSATDITIPQSSWNTDKMDGSGPSGITVDFDLMQMFTLDFQWIGSGLVRFGFHIDGRFIIAHQFSHANTSTEPYMSNASLPLRFEMENVASTGSSSSSKIIGTTMISEGHPEGQVEYPQSVNSGFTTISAPQGSWTPIRSFQLRSTINGVPVTGYSILRELSLLNTANTTALFQIVQDSTLTGANFVNHSPESLVQVDSSSTASTGGFVGFQAYIGSTGGGANPSVGVQDSERQSFLLYPGTQYTIRVRSLTTTAAAIFMSVNWLEVY